MFACFVSLCLSSAAQPPDRYDSSSDSLTEGSWIVVCLERDGLAVPGARGVTVKIKGNIATFAKSKADDADQLEGHHLRAIKLKFTAKGIVQVIEANADGEFDAPGPITTKRPNGNPHQPADNKFSPAPVAGTPLDGVYALTHDYLVISVLQSQTGSTTNYLSSTPGTVNQPSGPVSRTYFTVILKRPGTDSTGNAGKKAD